MTASRSAASPIGESAFRSAVCCLSPREAPSPPAMASVESTVMGTAFTAAVAMDAAAATQESVNARTPGTR